MPLNTRRAMDPRWPLHQRSVPQGFMVATIEIYRPTGDPVTGITWDVNSGGTAPELEWLYTGQARLQDNKDWRARRRSAGGDPVVQHAIRVQTPLDACPQIFTFDIIKVIDAPYDRSLETYTLYVRNTVNSSDAWTHNILCDIDTTYTEGSQQINGM